MLSDRDNNLHATGVPIRMDSGTAKSLLLLYLLNQKVTGKCLYWGIPGSLIFVNIKGTRWFWGFSV